MRNKKELGLIEKKEKNTHTLTVCFLQMGECREVLGGGPAPPSKL
jgi:hypothetical protein